MEQFTRVGDVELAYETFGDPADPAVLLIMGLGSQMIYWPEELCETLAANGYHVVRYDNRDAGRSTVLDHDPPDLRRVAAGELEPPYLLQDMAADAVGLLDALGIDRAHVVGASLGGMIAQRVAIDHPERVLSLASIMSTTGDTEVGRL
jgi:pimeloyl-ACP methyl ester carboxylesterase